MSAASPESTTVINGVFSTPNLENLRGQFSLTYEYPNGQQIQRVFTKDASDYYLSVANAGQRGIYWNVSGSCGGPAPENVYMLLYRNSCGSSTLEDYVLTAADGSYSITGLSNGSYKVKPLKTGYAFSPVEQILDFTVTAVTGVNFTSY